MASMSVWMKCVSVLGGCNANTCHLSVSSWVEVGKCLYLHSEMYPQVHMSKSKGVVLCNFRTQAQFPDINSIINQFCS